MILTPLHTHMPLLEAVGPTGRPKLAPGGRVGSEARRTDAIAGLRGRIERRLLVNCRVDPEVVVRVLPEPFRPQLVGDAAVTGMCLIRLAEVRPGRLPRWVGLHSENAAHRIAVEWDTPTGIKSGFYIPRRYSNSWVNIALGMTSFSCISPHLP